MQFIVNEGKFEHKSLFFWAVCNEAIMELPAYMCIRLALEPAIKQCDYWVVAVSRYVASVWLFAVLP